MADNWHIGNAATDGQDFRGWIVGHFINGDTAPIRTSEDVEIKWGVHPAGEERANWQDTEHRTTVLVSRSIPDQLIGRQPHTSGPGRLRRVGSWDRALVESRRGFRCADD